MNLSRRSLLRGAGAAGIGLLPFAHGLSRARAANGKAPVRFLAMSNVHGTWKPNWTPRGVGGGPPSETNFTLDFPNSILAPLEPWKSKLVVLDGIDYLVHTMNRSGGHEAGMKTMLTGAFDNPESRGRPNNMSVDQYLAEQVGKNSQFPSLELGVYDRESCCELSTMCFGPGGRRLGREISPAAVYSRLFGSMTGSSNQPDQAFLQRLKERRSVLDHLSREVTLYEKSLAGREKEKFQIHLNALRSIETRLATPVDAMVSCDAPVAPPMIDTRVTANVPAILKLQMDLITQAFACGQTRVATLQIFSAGIGPSMPWLGSDLDIDIHNGVAHRVRASDQNSINMLVRVQRWYAEMFAYLLKALDVPDPMGEGTVLDNTFIYWTNELGDPAGHRSWDIPTIVAGGGGGRVRQGRYLMHRERRLCYGSETPNNAGCQWQDHHDKHYAHNKVLTAAVQAMGIDSDYFGDPRFRDNQRLRGTPAGLLT